MSNLSIELLNNRGISLEDIYSLVKLTNDIKTCKTIDESKKLILDIIQIKEISDFITLGIILDIYTENNLLPDPLQYILSGNDPLFNLPELLSISILNHFGHEAIINYSYLIKKKTEEINNLLSKNKVNTFLTNILCVIASAASVQPY